MTPEDELKAARLAEDRHLEIMGKLGSIEKFMAIAAGTVIPEDELKDVSERIAHVVKEVTD